MILRKTVLATGALVALLASASVGSAKPAAPAAKGAATPVQCSTKLLTLRPHYPNPVKPLAGAAGSLSGAGATLPAPVYSMWAAAYSKKGTGSSKPRSQGFAELGDEGGASEIQLGPVIVSNGMMNRPDVVIPSPTVNIQTSWIREDTPDNRRASKLQPGSAY